MVVVCLEKVLVASLDCGDLADVRTLSSFENSFFVTARVSSSGKSITVVDVHHNMVQVFENDNVHTSSPPEISATGGKGKGDGYYSKAPSVGNGKGNGGYYASYALSVGKGKGNDSDIIERFNSGVLPVN